jgi:type III secretory pathway component EscR
LIRNSLLQFLPSEAVVALFEAFHVDQLYYLYAVIDLAIGLYLTYAGFSRR